jgi:hypothetical protein
VADLLRVFWTYFFPPDQLCITAERRKVMVLWIQQLSSTKQHRHLLPYDYLATRALEEEMNKATRRYCVYWITWLQLVIEVMIKSVLLWKLINAVLYCGHRKMIGGWWELYLRVHTVTGETCTHRFSLHELCLHVSVFVKREMRARSDFR